MAEIIVPDFQENGLWVKTRGTTGDRIRTRAYMLWCAVKARAQMGRAYTGCEMSANFKDFQFFASWCNLQCGYSTKGYHVDKDILGCGKVYGEDVCVFVPRDVNNAFIKHKQDRGEFPIGVHYHKKAKKFRAQVNDGNSKQVVLGMFDTPNEAFYAYKVAKECYMKKLAEQYKDTIDYRVYAAMLGFTVNIND